MRRMSEIIKDQKPFTFSPRTPVKHACEAMLERRVGAVLVTDRENGLLGIFTGRDAVLMSGGTFSVDGGHNILG